MPAKGCSLGAHGPHRQALAATLLGAHLQWRPPQCCTGSSTASDSCHLYKSFTEHADSKAGDCVQCRCSSPLATSPLPHCWYLAARPACSKLTSMIRQLEQARKADLPVEPTSMHLERTTTCQLILMLHFYDPGILLKTHLGGVPGSNLKRNMHLECSCGF